jgi:hypothetical protein
MRAEDRALMAKIDADMLKRIELVKRHYLRHGRL